ncbi:hypothetical protein IV203_013907 [Nitzschia inconspicua]|uniref:RNA ligase domain-containing protein n=1 Tax=Nitzschia inconspicua TaxID=303405 RepID=A0A9K3M6B5_9STRA|nr:hypothetical protein IV203_013907 [Nitzschia inconspicua]
MLQRLCSKRKAKNMAVPEKNPTQWTNFESLTVWYANRCQDNLNDLNVIVTFIQKWWRFQRKLKRPIKGVTLIGRIGRFKGSAKPPAKAFNNDDVRSIRGIARRLQCNVDPKLQQLFRAHEKLDGTNLGVRCDGAVFGRRIRIYGETYQGVDLEGVVPCDEQVRGIKYDMLVDLFTYDFYETSQLMIYGELICNPNKFDYSRRCMGYKYYCFGAMVTIQMPTEKLCRQMDTVLRRKGLNFHHVIWNNDHAVYRIMLNPAFQRMLEGQGISTSLLLGKGTLRQVCLDLKAMMMTDGFEGVVLTAPIEGTYFKWKTSIEDKSGGFSALSELSQSYSSFVLELAGIDMELVQCLIEVATPKERSDHTCNQIITSRHFESSANFTAEDLDAAYKSALTKFDSLEAYFEREEQWSIIQYLQEEVHMDLSAMTQSDQKIINKSVKSRVMAEYKVWHKFQKSGE